MTRRTTIMVCGALTILTAACGGGSTANDTEAGSTGGATAVTEASGDAPTTAGSDDTGETGPEERQSGGRTPRRLSVDQVRTSLAQLLGQTYRGGAYVFDPLDPQGAAWREDADLLDAFAGALGRPDYNYTVVEGLEAGMTFAKFVQDAARSTCRAAVEADIAAPPDARHVLLFVEGDDTLASAEKGARATVSALALRFWGRDLAPETPEVDALLDIFTAAASAPEWLDELEVTRPAGTPADGWRAVCIALVTDAQFYVY